MDIKAIVIGDDHYNTLGVVRSLGLANINISLIVFDGKEHIVERSRYVQSFVNIAPEKVVLTKAINTMLTPNTINVLFPVNDFAAEVCDEIELDNCMICIVPGAKGKLKLFENKEHTSKIAESVGLIIPQSRVINLYEQETIEWDRFPAIIKPLYSVSGNKGDITIVEEKSKLKPVLLWLKQNGYTELQIQEFIHGNNEYMVEVLGYVDRTCTPRYSKIIRKVREYPIKNGSTAFAQIVDSQEGLNLDTVTELIKRIGFYGIFDIEFKYADGILYFIEINMRNGAPSFAMTRLGFNLPYLWLCDAVEMKNECKIYTNKQYIMVETRDVVNMIKGYVSPQMWIKEFSSSQKLIWDRNDLMPSVLSYKSFVKEVLRRIISK